MIVWDAVTVAVEFVAYAGVLTAAGSIFFSAYSGRWLTPNDVALLRRCIGAGLLAAAAATVGKISVLAASVSDSAGGMLDAGYLAMVVNGAEGRATAARMLGLLLAADAWRKRAASSLSLAGSVLATTSFAWVGHAHAAHAPRLAISLLCVHLMCAAFWLGALPCLLILAQCAEPARLQRIAVRFSAIALGLVTLLLSAGAVLAAQLLSRPSDLWSTAYGRMLSLKLLLVCGLVCVAAFNKTRLLPQLRAGDMLAADRLRRSVAWEILLAALILVVTALFTTTSGPSGE